MQNCIMGIDPGLAHCGWGLIALPDKHNKQSLRLLACGEIKTKAGQNLALRLQHIYCELSEIFAQYQPSACAVEELYMNKNSTSALPVAHGRGIALLCAAQHEALVAEFSANRIKQAVTGNGKATKIQVQEMVALLLGLAFGEAKPAIRSDHAADALAAAICMFHQNGSQVKTLQTAQTKTQTTAPKEEFWKAHKNAGAEFERLLQQQK